MIKLLLVGAGGFLGSVLRYGVSGLVHRLVPATLFPLGTLVVNVAGCFAIGLVAGMAETRGVLSSQTRLFLLIGLLGGFTTFSTFGHESFSFVREAEGMKALLNVLLSVVLGLGAVWIGHAIARG
jgi:CrcB protein